MTRYRIRRYGSLEYPWSVIAPDAGKVAYFPTFEDARLYVLDRSRGLAIDQEMQRLSRLTPRRTA